MLNLPEISMIVALPALLLASGFFSGSETALFSLSPQERLGLRRRSAVGARIDELLQQPRDLLITLLVTNMTINVLYFVTTTVLVLRLEENGKAGALLMTLITTGAVLAIILVGEVTPKVVAAQAASTWVRLASLPLLIVHQILQPIRVFLSAIVIGPLARLFAPRDKPPGLSPEELDAAINLCRAQGVVDAAEEEMLQQVLSLGQLKVRDLMTPRVDVVAFDLSDPPQQLVQLIAAERKSHIPVYEEDLDHIAGLAFSRQILLARPQTTEQLSALIRQVRYVPELARADQLLVQFRKTGTTLAIVVDEYGGTAGLITLEDIVEHMVGDIAASHETVEVMIKYIQDGMWEVSGDIPLHDCYEAFDLPSAQRPPVQAGIATLGGLVMRELGHVPQVGDKVTWEPLHLQVLEMDGGRVQLLRVELRAQGDQESDS